MAKIQRSLTVKQPNKAPKSNQSSTAVTISLCFLSSFCLGRSPTGARSESQNFPERWTSASCSQPVEEESQGSFEASTFQSDVKTLSCSTLGRSPSSGGISSALLELDVVQLGASATRGSSKLDSMLRDADWLSAIGARSKTVAMDPFAVLPML